MKKMIMRTSIPAVAAIPVASRILRAETRALRNGREAAHDHAARAVPATASPAVI
jgi:hypothetical protein